MVIDVDSSEDEDTAVQDPHAVGKSKCGKKSIRYSFMHLIDVKTAVKSFASLASNCLLLFMF